MPPTPGSSKPDDGSPATDAPADDGRRAFFRSVSRQAVSTAGQAASIATELQRATGEAIGAALGLSAGAEAMDQETVVEPDAGPEPAQPDPLPDSPGGGPQVPPPYRIEGETLWLLDHLRYPGTVQEVECTTLSELSMAMLSRQISGAPLLGEVTAFGLWLALLRARGSGLAVKRTRLRTTGAALSGARSNVATIPWATARMVEAWDAAVANTEDEFALEAAMQAAAERVAASIRADVVRLARAGAAAIGAHWDRTFEIMTLGSTGYLGGREAGGAAGIAAQIAAEGTPVHVWVVEVGPADDGSRLTAWDLATAGIPTSIIALAAAGWTLATRSIDLVLVGADRISLDGAVTGSIGTYGLASLARQHGVPTYVAAPLATIDPGERDGGDPGVEWEPSPAVDADRPSSAYLATRVGSRGPLQDVTPPDLIDAIVTEAGLLRPPFAPSIASDRERSP
jgi:methylthioribose-1-phosphate isomerase